MLPSNQKKTMIGDCEACGLSDIRITLTHHNMWLCDDCLAKETLAIQQSKEAKQFVADARRADSSLELKQELFNAGTVAFVELEAAILQNAEIPADQKNSAVMTEVVARIRHLDAVIFAEEQAQAARRNERQALLVNAQNVVSKLHVAEQEKYKNFRIDYKPVVPKSVKPKIVSVRTSKPKFDKAALYAAATKYNVPASTVQSLIVTKNMTPEDAAKHLAGIMGLI